MPGGIKCCHSRRRHRALAEKTEEHYQDSQCHWVMVRGNSELAEDSSEDSGCDRVFGHRGTPYVHSDRTESQLDSVMDQWSLGDARQSVKSAQMRDVVSDRAWGVFMAGQILYVPAGLEKRNPCVANANPRAERHEEPDDRGAAGVGAWSVALDLASGGRLREVVDEVIWKLSKSVVIKYTFSWCDAAE